MRVICKHAAWAFTLLGVCLTLSPAWGQNLLWSENFDSLEPQLQPALDEVNVPSDILGWTHTPPDGWTREASETPGVGDPFVGVEEWEGWSFATLDFWTAADQQLREQFTNSSGVLAIADPDEWDDLGSPSSLGQFRSFITTPSISLAGAGAGQAQLVFDSSWRPDAPQKATLTASYDGGDPIEILRFESDNTNGFLHPDSTNETITLPIQNPEGASEVVFEFGLIDGENDWWWAIDNLELYDAPLFSVEDSMRVQIDRDTGEVTLINKTGTLATGFEPFATKGYEIASFAGAFDGGEFQPLGEGDPNWIRFTDPDSTTDLSEGHLLTGEIPADSEISLGAAWVPYYRDGGDVSFRYLNDLGEVIEGVVEFVGNDGNSYPFGDLNFDNSVDIQDWVAFQNAPGSADLANATAAVRYRAGDLNEDGVYSPDDFALFKRAFNQANGAGAFGAAVAAVPEPSTIGLCLLTALVLGARRISSIGKNMFGQVTSAPLVLAILGAVVVGGIAERAMAQEKIFIPIFRENFDRLNYGPNVEEGFAGDNVWTNEGPAGWAIDRSGVPGYDEPAENNGVFEWIGWSFANVDWWIQAAGDQNRSQFSRASGGVMVADPDEWDDATHPPSADFNWYETTATLPLVNIAGLPADSLTLNFDSSWRPEFDSNFHQSGEITVAFDGGASQQKLLWVSDAADPNFHADNTNEFVSLPLDNPNGASEVEVTFRMFDAGNDWWWAVDNLEIGFEAIPPTLQVDKTSGEMTILGSPDAGFALDSYSITSESGGLNPGSEGGGGPGDGDYNASGQVEQGDLDLVLLNWGDDTPPIPGNWTNDLPEGQIDQGELDGVLLNWGNTGGGGGGEGDGWLGSNLDAQDVDSQGDGPGESWESLIATNEQLWEAFLGGSTQLAVDDVLAIGEGYDTANGAEDLVFKFSIAQGVEVTGNVVYVSAVGSGAAVPEPSSLALLGLAALGGLACLWRKPRAALLVATVGLSMMVGASAQADGLLVREYRMGDSPDSGSAGSNAAPPLDAEGFGGAVDFILTGGNPSYVDLSATGRTGLGIEFDGDADYLEGERFGAPPSSTDAQGGDDLSGLTSRGVQFWARPAAAGQGGLQDVLLDTEQHGVRISEAGTWVLRFGGSDYDSDVPVVFDEWAHVHVASLQGEGGILYLDGEAVAAGGTRYNEGDSFALTIGASTGNPLDFPFPGLENHYTGIVDDVKFSAYGTGASFDAPYNYAVDNDVAAGLIGGVDPADVNLDGSVSGDGTGPAESDDVTAFVEGWQTRKIINGRFVGDVSTRMAGDLNFNGAVDIADWAILNLANQQLGAATASALGAAVPEPASISLVLLAAGSMFVIRKRMA